MNEAESFDELRAEFQNAEAIERRLLTAATGGPLQRRHFDTNVGATNPPAASGAKHQLLTSLFDGLKPPKVEPQMPVEPFVLDGAKRELLSLAAKSMDVTGEKYLTFATYLNTADGEAFIVEWIKHNVESKYWPLDLQTASSRTAADPSTGAGPSAPDECAHSDDFASVRWFGAVYDFTPNQAKCVAVLWDHWKRGGLAVSSQMIRDTAEVEAERLDVVFRNHPAWGTMIVAAVKGSYRLAKPGESPPSKV